MAETISRFVNFILDTLIYFTFLVILLFLFRDTIGIENVKWVSAIIYFLYYFLFEYFIGKTIGKIVTKSKVVSLAPNSGYFFLQIFLRTLMRFIPLDIISYLFTTRGLHDWISKTTVVKAE